MRYLLFVLLFLCGVSGQVWADDLKDDLRFIEVFSKSDKSNSELYIEAEKGNPEAQHQLGLRHYSDDGTSKDFAEGAKWLLRAAGQGHTDAQFRLGAMYWFGNGVPKNYEEAYFWSILAAVKRGKIAFSLRDGIEVKLTPSQIAEVQKRAKEWKPVVTQVKQ